MEIPALFCEIPALPTNLPWAITIDCPNRIAQYPCDIYPPATTGFHPLFLYESIWDVVGGFVALWLSRRHLPQLRSGDLASFWMVWYGGGRLALESLRQGWDWTVLGIPTAMLIGGALVLVGLSTIVYRHARPGAAAAAA